MKFHKIKKIFPALRYRSIVLFYYACGLVPRRSRKWIFGSPHSAFNDNSKYLFIYVTEHHPEIDAIWITDSKSICENIRAVGGKAFMRSGLMGIFHVMTGRFWFFSAYLSDVNRLCFRGAILVNLWHGIPIKKIEFDIDNGPLREKYKELVDPSFWQIPPPHLTRPNFVLSTSLAVSREAFSSAFRVDTDECLVFGYPRNDIFFMSKDECTSLVDHWASNDTKGLINKIKKFDHCLIYMPTWRDANPNFMEECGWNFSELNNGLKEKKILLLLKLHANSPSKTVQEAKDLSNIHVMDPSEDPYSVLPFTSGLLTDYSSIIFDYLLLDKPIILFPFDFDDYVCRSRGFYYKYEEFNVGPYIERPSDILNITLLQDRDEYKTTRKALLNRFFDHTDGLSSERIVHKFLNFSG